MIDYYYFPIALGLIFFGLGGFFYRRWKRNKDKGHRRFTVNNVLPILFMAVGCSVAAGIIFFSPSPSSRQALINGALHSPAIEIDEIDIRPIPEPTHTPLTAVAIAIHGRADIAQIADTLDHAVSFLPNHPAERWSARITIKTKKSVYDFTVMQTSDATNGTIIYLESDITDGWIIGTFRSDQFGGMLERLVHGGPGGPATRGGQSAPPQRG